MLIKRPQGVEEFNAASPLRGRREDEGDTSGRHVLELRFVLVARAILARWDVSYHSVGVNVLCPDGHIQSCGDEVIHGRDITYCLVETDACYGCAESA